MLSRACDLIRKYLGDDSSNEFTPVFHSQYLRHQAPWRVLEQVGQVCSFIVEFWIQEVFRDDYDFTSQILSNFSSTFSIQTNDYVLWYLVAKTIPRCPLTKINTFR